MTRTDPWPVDRTHAAPSVPPPAPKLTAICELREHGPREVSELLTLRQARALGISAVAYTESARRKFRHEDQREAARHVAATLDA